MEKILNMGRHIDYKFKGNLVVALFRFAYFYLCIVGVSLFVIPYKYKLVSYIELPVPQLTFNLQHYQSSQHEIRGKSNQLFYSFKNSVLNCRPIKQIILACLLAVAYAGNEDHRATKSSERGHMMSRQHGDLHSGRGSHHTGRVSHHQGSGKMNMGGHRWARSAEDQEAEEDGHRVMSNRNQGGHSGSWMGGQRTMDHGSWMGGNRNMEHGSWKSVDRNMEHGSHSGNMKMSSGMKHGDNRWGRHLDQDEEEQGSQIWGHSQLGYGRPLGGNNRWSRYHI